MGRLTVVGFGPGSYDGMTIECKNKLENADIIVGYTGYTELMKEFYPDKKYLDTPMMQETQRCEEALRLAEEEQEVCMICSGDSGVYGMASLILELSPKYKQAEIEVVSGVTAALSGGAILGAPLGHDFAIISLSDLLTPWELIELRLRCAAESDFAVCLYNPSSHKRKDYLQKACDILMVEKSPETVCGYVRNIGRKGQEYKLLTLSELRETALDMFTTVFVGNSQTKVIGGKMVTPRGYRSV